MTLGQCSASGCERDAYVAGLCLRHYRRALHRQQHALDRNAAKISWPNRGKVAALKTLTLAELGRYLDDLVAWESSR